MGRKNALLAAAVALLSYFPFEVVAKLTLIVAALMFVLNPFPLARLISIICILIMGVLNKLKLTWEKGQEEFGESVETNCNEKENVNKKSHAD